MATPEGYPLLPEELWQQISSLMTTKEWTMASGACKALQNLQPKQLKVDNYGSSVSALTWLTKHWREADSIEIDIPPDASSADPTIIPGSALECQAPDLTQMRRFDLTCGDDSGGGDESEQPGPQWLPWLSAILQRAQGLIILHLTADFRVDMPCMSRLKHLILKPVSSQLQMQYDLQAMVGNLPVLQTLYVGEKAHAWNVVMPKSLKHMCMSDIIPCMGYTIPEGCTMTIQSSFKDQTVVVRSKQSLGVQGIEVCSRKMEFRDSDWHWQPEAKHFMPLTEAAQSCNPLSLVYHELYSVDIRSLPSPAFCHLRKLHVEADDLTIVIPPLPHLEWVYIDSHETLSLVIVDVEVFAASIQRLNVGYREEDFEQENEFVDSLNRQLALTGRSLERNYLYNGDHDDEGYFWDLTFVTMFMVPGHLTGYYAGQCDCHCCWSCLHEDGV